MLSTILLWGTLAGLIHFAAVGLLYGNPLVDRMYQKAMEKDPAVRNWPSRPRYLVTQFLGTQIEVYFLTCAYFLLDSSFPGGEFAVLALLLAGIRIYPRFWNIWIQSTYPRHLLAIEFVNGALSTLVIIGALRLLA